MLVALVPDENGPAYYDHKSVRQQCHVDVTGLTSKESPIEVVMEMLNTRNPIPIVSTFILDRPFADQFEASGLGNYPDLTVPFQRMPGALLMHRPSGPGAKPR